MKSAANWVNNTIIQPVVNFFDPSTNRISGEFQSDIFFGSGSLTGGYSELNHRVEAKKEKSGSSDMLGKFGKISVGNAEGRIGIGNEKVSLSLKGVADVLSGTAQAGIQYKEGIGGAIGAKASVLSGRATVELDVYGWEIEAGVSGSLLSVGGEVVSGYFPDKGFKTKKGLNNGWCGGGIIFRVKPEQ